MARLESDPSAWLRTYSFPGKPTARFPSCHCSTIVELPNGDLLCAWYAGEHEAAPDVAVLTARKRAGAPDWDDPVVVADTPGKPEGNCVLFVNAVNRLWLFYGTIQGRLEGPPGPGVRFASADQKYKTSDDLGRTWSEDVYLRKEWGYVFRCKPITLANGDIIIGTGCNGENSRFLISADLGDSWFYTEQVPGMRNQHPTIIQRQDGSILALLRPWGEERAIGKAISQDNGRTWSAAVPTELPNPHAAVDMLRLQDGRVVLAFNNNPNRRSPLTLALSHDEGETWPVRREVETDEGEFSYPAVVQDRAGLLHLTYTWRRTHIKQVCLELEWIEGK